MKDKGITFARKGKLDLDAFVDEDLLHVSFSLGVPDDHEGVVPGLDFCVDEADIQDFAEGLEALASYARLFCGEEGKQLWSSEKMLLITVEQDDGTDQDIAAVLIDYCVVRNKDGERCIGLRITEPNGFHHLYAPKCVKKVRPLFPVVEEEAAEDE